jgi:hypothetical protein
MSDNWPCLNRTFFTKKLQQQRKIDDNIIHKLNAVNTNDKNECLRFLHYLTDMYNTRRLIIQQCISEIQDEIVKHPEDRGLIYQVSIFESYNYRKKQWKRNYQLKTLSKRVRLTFSKRSVKSVVIG